MTANGCSGLPQLSVVLPARDVAATIAEQLEALLSQRWQHEFEIVVVDNGSVDETSAIVDAYAARDPRVRRVRAIAATGVGYARNEGIRAANCDAIAICDGDDVVGDGWVAAMGDALRDHRYVTGPLEVDRLNSAEVVESRGRSFASSAGDFFGIFEFAHGCNIGLRRAAVEECGGFDDAYLFGEDVEFGLRMWQRGIALHFAPGAVVHYRYREGLMVLWRQARNGGRVMPQVARALARNGGPTPSRAVGLRNWAWMLAHVHHLADPRRRARWVWVAGKRVGHVQGSIRHRALYL